MTDRPEQLDLRSLDIAEEKRQEILRLFPEQMPKLTAASILSGST